MFTILGGCAIQKKNYNGHQNGEWIRSVINVHAENEFITTSETYAIENL